MGAPLSDATTNQVSSVQSVADLNALAQESFIKQFPRYFKAQLFQHRIEGSRREQKTHSRKMTLAGVAGLAIPALIGLLLAFLTALLPNFRLGAAVILIVLAIAGALANMFVDLATDQMKSECPKVEAFFTGFASISALPLLIAAVFGFDPKI